MARLPLNLERKAELVKHVVDDTVTATEANRYFSEVLRRVRQGNTITVTSHGVAVADIVPRRDEKSREERERAHQEFMDYLLTLPAQNLAPWTRDELYDDDTEGPG